MTRAPRSAGWALFRRPGIDEEVNDELAFHVDMTIRMLVDGGMSAADARAEAIRRFGDMAVVGTECRRYGMQRDRSRSRIEYLDEIRQDVVYVLRQIGRARAFAATAILTLALGIGASASVFSALYAVVLDPLPFADANRVVRVFGTKKGELVTISSGAEMKALRARTDAFSGVSAAVNGGEFTLTGGDAPELIEGGRVTANYFRLLGVSPMLGRGFLDSDDVPGAPHVALVSHHLWTTRFASDSTLIGRNLLLNDEQHTVVGVMPKSFDEAGTHQEMWTPLQLTPEQQSGKGGKWLRLTARLAPGVSLERATEAARAAERAVVEQSRGDTRNVGAVVKRYVDVVVGDARVRLFVLLGAAGFVLLIACVNVANLLLVRGSARAREFAIRAALGAGRGRLVRQLLAESLVLAVAGGVAGVLVAFALVKGFVAFAPTDIARLDQARINGVVLIFSFVVAIVSSVIAGLAPALRSASPALQSTLRDGGRGTGARRDRVRAVLVAAEVALAITLLTGSGLLIRTAWRLQHVDPGFNATRLMTARVMLPATKYHDGAQIIRTFDQIRAAVEPLPGVQRVAMTSVVPLSQSLMTSGIWAEGGDAGEENMISVDIRFSSPGYFDAMEMRVSEGRGFSEQDVAGAPQVAVISASLARKLWPGQSALGRRVDGMRLAKGESNFFTVVGVVPDVHDAALNLPVTPTLYMPYAQTQEGMWVPLGRSLVLVARTASEPTSMVPAIKRAIMTVDASLPLVDAKPMSQWLSASVATTRFNTMLLSALGVIALVLASVGIYGVVAYFVSQRTREIGVRMALGAAPRQIWQLVLRYGIEPIAWGAIMGGVMSLATARLLRDQLFEVSTGDPMTMSVVALVLLAVVFLATFIPTRRAMRVTPAVALASE